MMITATHKCITCQSTRFSLVLLRVYHLLTSSPHLTTTSLRIEMRCAACVPHLIFQVLRQWSPWHKPSQRWTCGSSHDEKLNYEELYDGRGRDRVGRTNRVSLLQDELDVLVMRCSKHFFEIFIHMPIDGLPTHIEETSNVDSIVQCSLPTKRNELKSTGENNNNNAGRAKTPTIHTGTFYVACLFSIHRLFCVGRFLSCYYTRHRFHVIRIRSGVYVCVWAHNFITFNWIRWQLGSIWQRLNLLVLANEKAYSICV